MTCIVASKIGKDGLFIGSDSLGSNVNGFAMQRPNEKIIETLICNNTENPDKMYLAFSGSFRLIQILRSCLVLPSNAHDSIIDYLIKDVIPTIIGTLSNYGFELVEGSFGGEGIIIYKNRIFYIGDDFQVCECENYYAVGGGQELALGSLFSSMQANKSSEESVIQALEVAELHNIFVRRPWDIRKVEDAN